MQNNGNLLKATTIYFLSCGISFITILVLNSLIGVNFLSSSMLKGTLQFFILPLIISVIVGYILTIATYQSRAKFAVLSILLAILIILTFIALYFSYTCQELVCIFGTFFLIAIFVITVPFSASIPVFFQEFPLPFSIIFVIIISAVFPTIASIKGITTRTEQKAEAKKERAILKESGIPIYDTNYKYFESKTLMYEEVGDSRNVQTGKNNHTLGEYRWLTDEGGFLYYMRNYKGANDYQLKIAERKPAKNFSDQELFDEDYTELKERKQKNNSLVLDVLNINNFPAIRIDYVDVHLQSLRIYRQGLIVDISILGSSVDFPKEELIKIAESLQVANKP